MRFRQQMAWGTPLRRWIGQWNQQLSFRDETGFVENKQVACKYSRISKIAGNSKAGEGIFPSTSF
jgi:hypothetical protein